MKLRLIAFTRRGAALAERIAAALAAQGHQAEARGLGAGAEVLPGGGSLKSWTAEAFAAGDGLIFVGACGIAVRAIAPHVKDKFTDPAVVAVDEAGRFAVPLLSGHVGGANALAEAVAAITGGQAAVSTATDVNGLFAVDVWAREHGLAITDRTLAKAVSAALLRGEKVGYASDFALDCPEGLHPGKAELGVWVTCRRGGGPFPETLRLVPRCLALGIGCRRGTPEAAIRAAVEAALPGWDLAAVGQVATIDLKKDEPGLLRFCEELGVPLQTYTAAELLEAEGSFTPSEFVRSVTGVDNVCERAAVRSGGRLAVPKRAAGGVTVAAAVLPGFWEM
jgi:cobalt-precorrin 5A hydrolase